MYFQSICIALLVAGIRAAPVQLHSRSTTYIIQSGDTFYAIGQKLNIPYEQLESANPGVDPKSLQIGQTISVPSGSSSAPATTTASSGSSATSSSASSSTAEPSSSPSPASTTNTNAGASNSGSSTVFSGYKSYTGSGSTSAGWPSESQWLPFSQLWDINSAVMAISCSNNAWGADNSADETNDIQTAIEQVSKSSGVDARFILAEIMQESKGCVRVPTTNNGVRNPGLLQDHNGSGTCAGVNPCPASEILQMIEDGVNGTPDGDGLKQVIAEVTSSTVTGAQAMYAAARKYNSGSVDLSDLGAGLGSTNSYSSDIANRLMGWSG